MNWRRVASWHEDEWVVARLLDRPGQLVLLALVTLLLPGYLRLVCAPVVALTFLAPGRRVEILAAGALLILYQWLPEPVTAAGPVAVALGVASALGLLVACLAAVRRFSALPAVVKRFPIATLHVLLLGVLGACTLAATRGYGGATWGAPAAAMAALIPFLLWRASYLALSGRRKTIGTSRVIDHLAWWFPVWGGTATPYGKGYDYLKQHYVTEAEALARCRASGLKLLVLALAWRWVDQGFGHLTSSAGLILPQWLGGSVLAVPDLTAAISGGPDRYPLVERWLSIAVALPRSVVELAAHGHVTIGLLRLFGFTVFRNTYKPLLSTTIVEFWNRYYYYFKELLVEFFFFPAFVALSGRRADVRIVLSVLAAASLGNLYYHLVSDYRGFFGGGMDQALQGIGSRVIYSLALGVGVAVSMLRERRSRGAPAAPASSWPGLRALRGMAGVWLFYALLHIWNVGRHTLGIRERATFFFSLAGL